MSLLQRFVTEHIASRVWQRDTSVFLPASAPAPVRASLAARLGWLDAPDTMTGKLPALETLAKSASADGLSQVHLLGMGGSSLCAEVLRETFSRDSRHGSLIVLDTTDERSIGQASESLTPSKALFLVASKSGTTIEVSSLERHFGSLMTRALGHDAGRHFVAITDPGTPLSPTMGARDHGLGG
jgi:glucose-6-phosphate isomerase